MATLAVPSLYAKILFNQKDVTTVLSEFVTGISVTDSVNECDNISLTLDDSSGKWRNQWYPVKTDQISIEFGYKGQSPVKVQNCFVDMISLTGAPDTVTINAKSGHIDKAMQTKVTKSYDNTTLRNIVNYIAQKHGLKVIGQIEDIKFKRKTQKNTSDESFLKKLAEEYGYYIAFKKGQLVFEKKENVKKDTSKLTITRQDCLRYSFRDQTSRVYKACTVTFWDAQKRQCITHTENVSGLKTGDTLIIRKRVESLDEAKKLAKSALTARNERQVEASLSVIGQNCYVAGAQINLTGFGVLSGVYTITRATHTLSSSGWTVSLTANRNELKKDEPAQNGKRRSNRRKRFEAHVQNPYSWTTIIDDVFLIKRPCINETAYRYEILRELVHQRFPGRGFWVSATTNGGHDSPEHPQGRAIDCGVDGMTVAESYVLEELAQVAGFNTINEYVVDSRLKTGDHMHIFI